MDFARLAQLGKKGCYTGHSFVSSASSHGRFTPKPRAEIINSSKVIALLKGNIENRAAEINRLALRAKNKYQDYLETKIEPCEAPSVAGAVVGQIVDFVADQETFGAAAYKACLNKQNKARKPLDEAQKAFTDMQNARAELFADYSELMLYAPSKETWIELCGKKLGADRTYTDLGQSVSELAQKALEKLKGELAAQAQVQQKLDRTINFLQAFLEALKQLLAAIAAIFDQFITGLGHVTKFIAKHPTVFWVGAGLTGLAVLAFVLRPYITIFTMLKSKV